MIYRPWFCDINIHIIVSIIVLSRYYYYKLTFSNHMVLGAYFDKHFQ